MLDAENGPVFVEGMFKSHFGPSRFVRLKGEDIGPIGLTRDVKVYFNVAAWMVFISPKFNKPR